MRVRFALVFGKKAEFIIFDEPTNNLDEVTWEIFLSACKQSKASILLVTHDYEFIEEFEPDFFLAIKGQSIDVRHKALEDILADIS
jgi:ATPase subunit of ABC transporter with duplicated ATPase domains